MGVRGEVEQPKPTGVEEPGEDSGVIVECGDEGAGAGERGAGELDLTTGLHGDDAAARQGQLGRVGGDGTRAVVTERCGQLVERGAAVGTGVGGGDEPLELGTHQLGRTQLEAHQADVRLRRGATA